MYLRAGKRAEGGTGKERDIEWSLLFSCQRKFEVYFKIDLIILCKGIEMWFFLQ